MKNWPVGPLNEWSCKMAGSEAMEVESIAKMVRESSFNMTRGDEDIEIRSLKF